MCVSGCVVYTDVLKYMWYKMYWIVPYYIPYVNIFDVKVLICNVQHLELNKERHFIDKLVIIITMMTISEKSHDINIYTTERVLCNAWLSVFKSVLLYQWYNAEVDLYEFSLNFADSL